MARQRYTGPAYPFGGTIGTILGGKPDVNVVVTSITNILTTPKGSVPYDPHMGSIIPLLIFEILDDITMSLIGYYTYKDLTEQEPRIAVQSVTPAQEGEHRVTVQVGFSIVGDPDERVYCTGVRYNREMIGVI